MDKVSGAQAPVNLDEYGNLTPEIDARAVAKQTVLSVVRWLITGSVGGIFVSLILFLSSPFGIITFAKALYAAKLGLVEGAAAGLIIGGLMAMTKTGSSLFRDLEARKIVFDGIFFGLTGFGLARFLCSSKADAQVLTWFFPIFIIASVLFARGLHRSPLDKDTSLAISACIGLAVLGGETGGFSRALLWAPLGAAGGYLGAWASKAVRYIAALVEPWLGFPLWWSLMLAVYPAIGSINIWPIYSGGVFIAVMALTAVVVNILINLFLIKTFRWLRNEIIVLVGVFGQMAFWEAVINGKPLLLLFIGAAVLSICAGAPTERLARQGAAVAGAILGLEFGIIMSPAITKTYTELHFVQPLEAAVPITVINQIAGALFGAILAVLIWRCCFAIIKVFKLIASSKRKEARDETGVGRRTGRLGGRQRKGRTRSIPT